MELVKSAPSAYSRVGGGLAAYRLFEQGSGALGFKVFLKMLSALTLQEFDS